MTVCLPFLFNFRWTDATDNNEEEVRSHFFNFCLMDAPSTMSRRQGLPCPPLPPMLPSPMRTLCCTFQPPPPMIASRSFLFNFCRTNATDDNEDKAYSAFSPAAPHAATSDDDIALQRPPAAADVSLFLFYLISAGQMRLTTMRRRHILPHPPLAANDSVSPFFI